MRPPVLRPNRLPKKPIKPYIRPDKRENKSMTIVTGFRCSDGLIIAADQQISAMGAFKYNERKIFEETQQWWSMTLAYSGLPSLAKEAWEKITKIARQLDSSVDNEKLQDVLDDVLTGMGRQYTEMELQLLIALTAGFEDSELLKFDGKGLHRADNFNFLGVGDSSLIRFLCHTLYSPAMDTQIGANLAIYLIHKAETHIDHCGGPINTIILTSTGYKELSASDIESRIKLMEEREKLLPEMIIQASSSSPISP